MVVFMDLLVLTATLFEQEVLRGQLEEPVCYEVAGRKWAEGKIAGRNLLLVETGMGAVNCAHALSCVLQARSPVEVWQVGVGGAYARSGLQPGDLAVASEENYGDVGVRTAEGWQGAELIGIPLAEVAGTAYYNSFPLDAERAKKIAAFLSAEYNAQAGPFVTVQECTGTDALGAERGARFAAICENMEGAAAAHLCRLYGVDFIELRGISNIAARRQRDQWQLPLACRRAQEAALGLLYNENF
jgi:futalosine hydrolase